MRRTPTVCAAALLLCPLHVGAQDSPPGGFLSAYRPDPDARAAFYEGYARHLEWHRRAGDTLTWYGWDVVAGPGQGLFVDGMFGAPLAALDERVDPAGDARDNVRNVEAHGAPSFREILLLRAELSTATPLEQLEPTPLVQVVRYAGGPAALAAVETELRRAAEQRDLLPFTVYESVAGHSAPGLFLLIWRDRMASFDEPDRSPERVVRRGLARGDPQRADIPATTVELWRYRRDLTYLGEAGGSP